MTKKNHKKQKRRHFILLSILVLLLVGTAVFATAQNLLPPTKQVIEKSLPGGIVGTISTKSDDQSALEVDSANASSSSPSTSSNANTNQGQTSSKTSAPQPINCKYVPIPYKHTFVYGRGPYNKGSSGATWDCDMSDGSPSTSKLILNPTDEINYLNVTSTDYATAQQICANYLSGMAIDTSYMNACMGIVWRD